MYSLAIRLSANQQNVSSGITQSASTAAADYCTLRLAGLTTGPIPNTGPDAAIVMWALFAMSTVFLMLRIYCKVWRSCGLWWDDLVLIISWITFMQMAGTCQRVIDQGFGKYFCDVPPENLSRISFWGGGVGSTAAILAIVWSKTSFGITILRLTRYKLKAFVLGIVIIMNTAIILQVIFAWVKCNRISKNWNPKTIGTCWNLHISTGYAVCSGAFSGFCDIFFALLPWHLVWSLQIPRREKIGVVIAMSMGVFAGITAFVKSAKLLSLALLIWAAAEISTTIMASCIPVLRVIFRELHQVSASGSASSSSSWQRHHGSHDSNGDAFKGKQPVALSDAAVAEAATGTGDNDNSNRENTSDNNAPSPIVPCGPPSLTGGAGRVKGEKKAPEKWGTRWKFEKGAFNATKPLTNKCVTRANNITVGGLADDISERVLVVEGTGSSDGQGEREAASRLRTGGWPGSGFIVQTRVFEVQFEGRGELEGSGWRDGERGYELDRVRVGRGERGCDVIHGRWQGGV